MPNLHNCPYAVHRAYVCRVHVIVMDVMERNNVREATKKINAATEVSSFDLLSQ